MWPPTAHGLAKPSPPCSDLAPLGPAPAILFIRGAQPAVAALHRSSRGEHKSKGHLPGRRGSPCWPLVSPKLSLAPICSGGQARKKAKTCGATAAPPLRCQHFQPSGDTCERFTFVNLQLDNYVKTHGVVFENTLLACSTGTNLLSPVRKT